MRRPLIPTLFPYTTLFRSRHSKRRQSSTPGCTPSGWRCSCPWHRWVPCDARRRRRGTRSEEHTSELQSRRELVCRLLLEKKKEYTTMNQFGTSLKNRLTTD